MKLNYPNDAYDYESYGEYVERKKGEEASASLATMVLGMIFKFFRFLFIYSPFLLLSYYLIQRFTSLKYGNFYFFLAMGISTYFMYALIFLLKGILIKLKSKANNGWIVMWILCVAITCLFPTLFMQEMTESMFRPDKRQLENTQIITWTAAIIFGCYVYYCYKFLKPTAPRIVNWSFKLGYEIT